jgi:hypothetical protein
MHPSREPRWWPLFLLVPVVFGLLMIESNLAVAAPWHQLLQIGIVLGAIVFIQRWVDRTTLRCCEE